MKHKQHVDGSETLFFDDAVDSLPSVPARVRAQMKEVEQNAARHFLETGCGVRTIIDMRHTAIPGALLHFWGSKLEKESGWMVWIADRTRSIAALGIDIAIAWELADDQQKAEVFQEVVVNQLDMEQPDVLERARLLLPALGFLFAPDHQPTWPSLDAAPKP